MAIIWSSSIETETDAFTTEWTGKSVAAGNTLTVSTTAAHVNSGAKGAKAYLDGTAKNCYAYYSFSEDGEVYGRAYFKLKAGWEQTEYAWPVTLKLMDGTSECCSMAIRGDAGTPSTTFHWYCRIRLTGGSYVVLHQGDADTVTTDEWHLLEFHWKAGSGSDGGAEFKIDGSSVASDFTRDCSAYLADQVIAGVYQPTTCVTAADNEMYFDDVALDDAGWIGSIPDVFESDLETETSAFTTEWDGKTEEGSNTLTISTTAAHVHGGTNGALQSFDGTNNGCYAYKTISDKGDVYTRIYIKLNSAFEMDGTYKSLCFIELMDGTQYLARMMFRSLTEATTLGWYASYWNGTGNTFASGIGTPPTGEWVLVEMHWTAGTGSDGGIEIKINSSSVYSDFNGATSALLCDTIKCGASNTASGIPTATSELYWDDFAADSLSWLGPVETATPVEITPPLLTTSLAIYNPTVENETIGLWDMGPFIYGAESGGVDVYPPKLASLLTMHSPVVYAVDVPTAVTPNLVTSQLTMLSPTVTVKDILKLTVDINGKPIVYDGPVAIITGANSDVANGDDLCIRVYGSTVELFVNGVRVGDPYLFLGLKDSTTLTLKVLGTGGAVDSIETFPGDPPVPSDVG